MINRLLRSGKTFNMLARSMAVISKETPTAPKVRELFNS